MTRTKFEKPLQPAANDGGAAEFRAQERIAAPAHRVWKTLSDVMHWPSWLPTVESIVPLDGPRLKIGNRFKVSQPKLRTAIWRVTDVNVGRSFRWESKTFGLRMWANHTVSRINDGASIQLEFGFAGLLAPLAVALYGKLTRTYLTTEAQTLKHVAERD